MLANLLQLCPGGPAPKTTLTDLIARFEAAEANENPDADVPLSSLRATEAGTVIVPDLGEHVLTDWSRNQLGHAVGIAWDRFFAGAPLPVAAEDLNRRLDRASGVVRLRTTKAKPEEAPGDGTLKAVVSTDFSTVKDATIASMLADAIRAYEPDARVFRSAVTDLSTTFVVRVGEPYRLGGPGKIGDLWGGLLVRNSGVGYAKLVVSLHLVRLACMNGMAVPVPLPDVVRARHRWLDEYQVREALTTGLKGVGDRIRTGTHVVAESVGHEVDDIEAEIRRVLRDGKLSVRLVRPVLSAYAREPHASRFGVSQALTLAAQDETPEVRLQLEQIAGRYLAAG
jgi:hypothetical protein